MLLDCLKGEKKNHPQMALYSLTLDVFLIKADIFPVAAELKVLRRAVIQRLSCKNDLFESIWDIGVSKNLSLTYTICSVCKR